VKRTCAFDSWRNLLNVRMAMPPSLRLDAVAVISWLGGRLMRNGMSTGWRKYRRRSRTIKFSAALKQRAACSGLSGFCSTKLAPQLKASCVVVFPFTTANATDRILLWVWRSAFSRSMPFCKSSQSIMTASNLRFNIRSLPARNSLQTSILTEIFSSAGRSTSSKLASWLMRRESRFMAFSILTALKRLRK
jgi:hypothetical protein